MRKYCLIFLGLLAIFMAGCSKVVEHEKDFTPHYEWMTDLSLPVPLMFGAEAVYTRAAIETLDELADKDFAFFAVNKNAAKLTESMDITFPDGARARSKKGADGNVYMDFVGADGSPKYYYYPMAPDSKDSYSFYAYHSDTLKSVAPVMERNDSSIVVDVPVAEKSDILWGAAVASKYTDFYSGIEYDGFNARYIRKAGINPMIKFEHPASCLKFQITKKGTSTPAIQSIELSAVDIPSVAALCVVDWDGDGEDRSGTFIAARDSVKAPIGTINKMMSSGETVDLPDELFIVPQTEPLNLQLDMKLSDGSSSKVVYRIDPKNYGLDNGFESGTRYRFNLIVHSVKEIKIQVSVEAYEDAFDEIFEYDPDDIVEKQ